jgi:hypothetical protein
MIFVSNGGEYAFATSSKWIPFNKP